VFECGREPGEEKRIQTLEAMLSPILGCKRFRTVTENVTIHGSAGGSSLPVWRPRHSRRREPVRLDDRRRQPKSTARTPSARLAHASSAPTMGFETGNERRVRRCSAARSADGATPGRRSLTSGLTRAQRSTRSAAIPVAARSEDRARHCYGRSCTQYSESKVTNELIGSLNTVNVVLRKR
jgi:hypothetical protein